MTEIRTWLPDAMALVILAAIIVISLIPVRIHYPATPVVAVDVMGHFACYFLLGFCGLYRRHSLVSIMIVLAAIIIFGGLIELVQSNFGRDASITDFLANATGAGTAWIALLVWRRLRQTSVLRQSNQ